MHGFVAAELRDWSRNPPRLKTSSNNGLSQHPICVVCTGDGHAAVSGNSSGTLEVRDKGSGLKKKDLESAEPTVWVHGSSLM